MRRAILLLTLTGAVLLACSGVVLAQTASDEAERRTTTSAPPKTPARKIPDQYIVVLKDDA